MKMPSEALAEEIDDKAVLDYLRHHPHFFEHYPGLLAELEIPHPSGNAVSLIERQVKQLREQRQQMKHKLEDLIQHARRNEDLSRQIHRLTLELIGAAHEQELSKIFTTLRKRLSEDFSADAMAIRLFSPAPEDYSGPEFANRNDLRLARFAKVFTAPAPLCGRLDPELLDYLFGNEAEAVASAALIPLWGRGVSYGLLAIGSYDPEQYHHSMGTLFLQSLGEMVTQVLKPYLSQ